MSARRNGKILTRETPVKYCLFSWDELSDDLSWVFEKRAGADSYSCLQGTREAVLEEFAAWVRAAPGMDVRILREGGHNSMHRRYLLAERIGEARTTSVAVRSAEADALRMAAVTRYDPPLLIGSAVDEAFAETLIVAEREYKSSRRCSILAGAGGPLRPGMVLSRTRTERVADEISIKQAHMAQLTAVGVAVAGSVEGDRELADSVEFDYYPTPKGGIATGGILLNLGDAFAPAEAQSYGAIVLRGAPSPPASPLNTQVRFESLVFDGSIDSDDERRRVADSLYKGADVLVGMPAAGAR